MNFKSTHLILLVFSISNFLFSQIKFDDYFINKSLRIDYFRTGNDSTDYYSMGELIQEDYWAGSKTNLIDSLNYGYSKLELFDTKTNTKIFSKTYSTLFTEWQTTTEAKQIAKTFFESVNVPLPKHNVTAVFYERDKNNNWVKRFTYPIDLSNAYIDKNHSEKFPVEKIYYSNSPAVSVDIVFLPEGYTSEQMDKFRDDCKRFANYLFNVRPFKENKNTFNIWAVFAPSKDSGSDIPADNIWKNTLLNSRFYTFGLERYLMTEDYRKVKDIASNAPYDQIYILVNTDKYGGGSIYNYYSVTTTDNANSEYVFTHEFGHGFAFLADEYYNSTVSYNNYYPLNLEPLEPNLTTLVNFDSKWKKLIDKSTPLPTPDSSSFDNKVGLFQGGGYSNEGIYRPMRDCSMKSKSINNFCLVCKDAIQIMIDWYTK